jgi:hypothetical protein
MALRHIPFDQLAETHLQGLIDAKAAEDLLICIQKLSQFLGQCASKFDPRVNAVLLNKRAGKERE